MKKRTIGVPPPTLKRMLQDFGSQQAIADEFQISQPIISQWMTGSRSPSVKSAQKIEQLSRGRYRADDLVFGR